MSQFTLYENLNKDSRKAYPYFVDIQNDLVDSLNTRLVIPLTSSKSLGKNIEKLCPTITLDGEAFILLTHQMTNVPVTALKNAKGSLQHLRSEIISAVDFLVTGI
jgi:toxin CcdB